VPYRADNFLANSARWESVGSSDSMHHDQNERRSPIAATVVSTG
jgi:hypothetical protein